MGFRRGYFDGITRAAPILFMRPVLALFRLRISSGVCAYSFLGAFSASRSRFGDFLPMFVVWGAWQVYYCGRGLGRYVMGRHVLRNLDALCILFGLHMGPTFPVDVCSMLLLYPMCGPLSPAIRVWHRFLVL